MGGRRAHRRDLGPNVIVADSVTAHEAWGLGSRCNCTADPTIVQAHGFQVPVAACVRMHSKVTRFP